MDAGYVSGQVFRERAKANNAALIHDMLKAGMPVDTPQEDGCTALWLAAEAGAAKTVAVLLQFSANPQAPKILGHITPLYIAAQNGHAEVIDLLLGTAADPNIPKDTGSTPLFIASQQNFPQIARSLLLSGAKVSASTKQGITSLMIASFQGNVQVIKQLLAAGADPYERGNGLNAFEWAAENGYRDRVQSIFDASPSGGGAGGYNGGARTTSMALSVTMNNQSASTHTPQTVEASIPEDHISSFRFAGYQPQYLNTAIDVTNGYDRASRAPRGGLETTNYSTYVSRAVNDMGVAVGGTRGFPKPTELLSNDTGNMQTRDFNATRMNADRIRDEEVNHNRFRSRAAGDSTAFQKRSSNGPTASSSPSSGGTVDQQWESFKSKMGQTSGSGARDLDDRWMYSHDAVLKYGANIDNIRRQQGGNRGLSTTVGSGGGGEGNGSGIGGGSVVLPQPKIQRLSEFLDAGKGAKGPTEVEMTVRTTHTAGGVDGGSGGGSPAGGADAGSENDWY